MKRSDAILIFVLGYLVYLSYVSVQTVKAIEDINIKTKTNRIK